MNRVFKIAYTANKLGYFLEKSCFRDFAPVLGESQIKIVKLGNCVLSGLLNSCFEFLSPLLFERISPLS
jgi:hypothetical protein